jgi:hypothetical protein
MLEMLATPEAKEVLQLIAQGYPEHGQTRGAQDAWLRLKQRHPLPKRWLNGAKERPSVGGNDTGWPCAPSPDWEPRGFVISVASSSRSIFIEQTKCWKRCNSNPTGAAMCAVLAGERRFLSGYSPPAR